MKRTNAMEVETNIYFVNLNPTLAAEQLPDEIVRQILRPSIKMLANAYYLPKAVHEPPMAMKQDFLDHPGAQWVLEDYKHWDWMRMHAWALMKEHEHRFIERPEFESDALKYINAHLPGWMRNKSFVDPPMLIPDQMKRRISGVVASYRNYIIEGKKSLHVWTKRKPPAWLIDLARAEKLATDLVNECTLQVGNLKAIRPKGISDEHWENIVKVGTNELNGLSSEYTDEDTALIDKFIEQAAVELVNPDKHAPKDINDLEWEIVTRLATELVNGLDPFNPPHAWDYNRQ